MKTQKLHVLSRIDCAPQQKAICKKKGMLGAFEFVGIIYLKKNHDLKDFSHVWLMAHPSEVCRPCLRALPGTHDVIVCRHPNQIRERARALFEKCVSDSQVNFKNAVQDPQGFFGRYKDSMAVIEADMQMVLSLGLEEHSQGVYESRQYIAAFWEYLRLAGAISETATAP